MPLGKVPVICRTIHPFAASGNGDPRFPQKIEFVFSASSETSGREPQELPLHCPDVKVRDLADSAPIDLFSFPGSGGLCRCAAMILIFHKYSFAAIDCEQIRH
jgi:hypothetical protein